MKTLLSSLFAFMAMFTVASAQPELYTKADNVAVSGYDTVAYFTQNQPVKGSANFSTTYKGATWQFASQQHLDLFTANPAKYAPQYGGYCAFATAHNGEAPGNPLHWHIDNGKLYLNLNSHVQSLWLPKKAEFITRADRLYPELIK